MPSESFRRHFYVRHMNYAAKNAACAPKVKYGECKKKWHGTPFYNGVGWVDKPNVSDGLWICWVDNQPTRRITFLCISLLAFQTACKIQLTYIQCRARYMRMITPQKARRAHQRRCFVLGSRLCSCDRYSVLQSFQSDKTMPSEKSFRQHRFVSCV